jgi:hypothetical protein
VKYTLATVRSVAEAATRKAAQSTDNPAGLINIALVELVQQRCELPGCPAPRLPDAGCDGRCDAYRG